MSRLGWAEEVLYRRLHSVVDDFGRYYADPGMLRAACYPRQLGKVSDSDIGKWLQTIADAGLVRVYPASDGERYLEVLDFGQQVRAKKSKFPSVPSGCVADAQQEAGKPTANAPVFVSVSVIESVSESADGFEEFWKAFPAFADRKAAKPQCLAKWKSRNFAALKPRIMSALKAQKASDKWKEEGGKWIPAPLTWLNQERWEAVEAKAEESPWWQTRRGCEERAAELDMPKWSEVEAFSDYSDRIRAAAEQRQAA